MTIYTTEQKFSHLKKWVTSRQLLKDYCDEAGVSRSAMSLWAINILGPDYTSTLKNASQKALLLKKIEKLESSSPMKGSSTALVKVNKSKDDKSVTAHIMTSADFLPFVVTMQSPAMLQPHALARPHPVQEITFLTCCLYLYLSPPTVGFVTFCKLIPMTSLIGSFCSYARDFASSFFQTLHYCNALALS